MPALPLAPNVLKVRFVGTTQARPFVHVMHAQYSGGTPAAADCAGIATAFRNAYNTNFAAAINNSTSITLVEVTDLASSVGNVGSNNTVITGTGGAATGVSVASAAVVSWKNALHYRGGHSRTYFPLRVSADVVSGNQLLAAYVTTLSNGAAAFVTALTNQTTGTLTWSLAMLSYYHGHALRNPPISFVITGAQVHNRLDTQRRRLGKEF
jgi:hypothetical protein